MRKSELVQSCLSLLNLAATAGIVVAALFWWQLHPVWAVVLGAVTFLIGWTICSIVAFLFFVRHVSATVPCPRCRRELSVWYLRADGKPVHCPTCGELAARDLRGSSP